MKPKFSIAHEDKELTKLVEKTDKKVLAVWAIDSAKRVLAYFEKEYPNDNRPQKALETLQKWIDTGIFKMAEIRKASLDSHAAARDVGKDSSNCTRRSTFLWFGNLRPTSNLSHLRSS